MRPTIEMFWVAEYWDGQAMPQYDPINRIENPYMLVDHKKVKKLWGFPISPAMALMFPGTSFNPSLKPYCVEVKGSKGFFARRTEIKMSTGGQVMELSVKCYIIGIESGPRREIYPDGTVIDRAQPESTGETQDLLHHG